VKIDGERVGEIRNADTVDFNVTAGEHKVLLTIDWVRSPEVTVNVRTGERAELFVAAGPPSAAVFDLLKSLFKRTGYPNLTLNRPGSNSQEEFWDPEPGLWDT
jgi:hypothetical protein